MFTNDEDLRCDFTIILVKPFVSKETILFLLPYLSEIYCYNYCELVNVHQTNFVLAYALQAFETSNKI